MGAALGAGLVVAIAIGCGGSTSSTIDSTDGGSSGAPAPPPPPAHPPPPPPPPGPPPPPLDAGKDAGNIDAPTVTIQYMTTCPSFTPCDASPVGTWKLSGGCISSAIFADVKTTCPNFDVTNVTITAKGITTITATNVSQMSHSDFSGTVYVPATCSKGVSGANCPLLDSALTMPMYGGFDTATCVDSGKNGVNAGCNCDVTKATDSSSSDTYTFASGVMTTGAGLKFDVCVNPANTLTTRQQNTNGTPGPETFTATK